VRRLLRLSLEGFKTFPGRTELDLAPGLTAIVGPNGSGKSNLIDAIAWAVGDRSRKSMRGEAMDDLLFHGDSERKAASHARVTLSFANEDRLLGIDFSEVTLSRDLRRGEGARVWLNGVEARAKDVHSIMSGTGLAGGFSLVRQGLVDRVVLGGPEDVGRWLEESATISAYRAQKREAVERLRKADENFAEAERRNAALKRELGRVRERAAQARARRVLEAERFRLRRVLTGWERNRIDAALAEIAGRARGLQEELGRGEVEHRERALRRERLEEELSGTIRPGAGCPVAPARAAEELRSGANRLHSAADRLTREGETAWHGASSLAAQAAETIRALLSPSGERLGELRRLAAEERALDQEERRRAAELAELNCERARLEERRRGLGDGESGAGDPEEAARALDAAERQLAAIGPVDETAEAREAEILGELTGLAPVLADLGSSRTALDAFLRELDACTSRLFEETRKTVERRFAGYCELLFEGGEASLRPSERTEGAADPFDAAPPGVEVRVKLPRKPDVPLTLLSGGERSLAGLALVLALAAGEGGGGAPSGRLLILDEVDAALDEANAARLARLLRELRDEHQILCVTHNKLTMRQASQLVGVTAGPDASSRLLHVRLEEDARGGSAA
jgi:chromosome segregation protein